MKRTEGKPGRRDGADGTYGDFMARLEARIPDEVLIDQLERELTIGGDAPDLREMAIRQKARQDVEAHKGYRGGREKADEGGLTVRIVRFSPGPSEQLPEAGSADER